MGRDMGDCGQMGKIKYRALSFLATLLRNQAGNTLAIMAIALIPLAGMIGGGLDMSRGYLAKTRLQNACDAGVLAGRKVMATKGVIDDAVRTEVRKYTTFNFPTGYLGTNLVATDINPTLGANEQIDLSLSATVPTAVMQLFGKNSISVTATCSARNDYTNIDIMLVLDTTGSMACTPSMNTSECSTYANANKVVSNLPLIGKSLEYIVENSGGSRMAGLRTALSTMQSQMATIESQMNLSDASKRKRVRWAIVPFSQMVNAGFSTDAAGTKLYDRQPTWFNTSGYYIPRSCSWFGGNCYPVDHDSNWLNNTWDGCVEEQSTSNNITSTSSTIPSTAYDMLYDTIPSSTATRWLVADPDAAVGQYACPKAMSEFKQMNATDFNNYFTAERGFVANGGTYLDLGLLWAARLLSRSGNWASNNPTSYNTFPVSRYLIFMTDGNMDTGNSGYGAYNRESVWKRVTTNGAISSSNANHTARMLLTCNAIKNMGVKIYTISFSLGSDLSDDLIDCSSSTNSTSPEFAYKADSSNQLNTVFRNIGENIGSLRLSR
ncbi:TadE/TadG family type IV pilus assembly protein [Sphingobium sp. CR2-8]|uniref:TadE/TadG family type IV pilus assembly protein n=1 Tax=Sphingobium sp. CR2-8 TaxID=1306534 RepID=UPI002DB95C02|nr:TadE/TadG family type IV pilus assembly protein [Sphingobium sp. CR2-8]MEC3910893.1 TadE/TadG family type IV pilus assembly protein [Sphingobium sp. CR2-8]